MKKVIIADDEEDVRWVVNDYVRDFFGRHSIEGEVEEVDDGQRLIERVIGGNYDLIISDYAMKKISGGVAVLKIRDTGLKTPFYIMSGDTSRKEEVISFGATGFIFKGDEFRDGLDKVLNNVFLNSLVK